MPNRKFYVVWTGHAPGIYDSWEECEDQVKNFPGARYKAFPTQEEATRAFRGDDKEEMYALRAIAAHAAPIINYDAFPEICKDAIAVDAACAGNPGRMEYRGVDVATGAELFHFGPVEKGEILAYTKESAITAADCYELFAEYPVNIKKCLCASDIACTKDGTSFTLTLGGESKRAHTRLLGAHAAENIALAAEAAFAVGMTLDEIVCAIENIDFIEHRLQLIKSGDVNILDDGYNSNVKGARAALKVLKLFDGRKIVVTPGLVELGVLEKQENSALGSELAGFDMVILVGDTLVQPVREGYLQNGGDAEIITVCQTLAAAQEQLKNYLHAGDTVLFLNDLPDVV